MSIRRVAVVVVALSAFVLLWPSAASAHERGTTAVLLDIEDEKVTGRVQLPLDRLEKVTQLPLTSVDSYALVPAYGEQLTAYVAEHLGANGVDGTAWDVELGVPAVIALDGLAHLNMPITLTPPAGTVSDFTLRYDGILHQLKEHKILVSAGLDGGDRKLVGVLQKSTTNIAVERDALEGASFGTMVHHGFAHVADGADHLLFLLVLLLPAPLVVSAAGWQPGASGWKTLRAVVHVVTAFTIGHSITLVASALDWVDVPSRPVEILIAVSVGAGAVHAIRPLIGHREALIAAGFGLVHGLAFAGILDDLGLSRSTTVGSLFGFNIGIELAQLAAVGLVFPSLYAMSRTRWYAPIRIGGASFALVAAASWVADRAGWLGNPIQGIEDAAVENPFAIAGTLAVIAAGAVVLDRMRREQLLAGD